MRRAPPSRPDASLLAVRDPATPLSELASLVARYPADFLLNPIVPLLPVLHGEFFASTLGTAGFSVLVAQPALPSFVLLDLLGFVWGAPARVLCHPRLPPEKLLPLLLQGWASACASDPVGATLLRFLLADEPGPDGELTALPEGEAVERVRQAVEALALSEEPAARAYAAGHALASGEALARLASDPRYRVRQAVALNPASPPELRLRLAQGGDPFVLAALARDPCLLPGLAGALAACPLVQTRALLAEHPGAPAPVLAALASDPSWLVRRAVAWNIAIEPELLATLASDPRPEVRVEARWREASPASVAYASR